MDNINSLKRQAELLLEKLEGKRYVVSDVNARLQAAAAEYPRDTVVVAMAKVFDRFCENDTIGIISQAKLEEMYNDLVGLNASGTVFREVLGDLLLTEKVSLAHHNSDYINQMRNDPNLAPIAYDGDAKIKSELDQAFENRSDKYDQKLATNAKNKVEIGLRSLGILNGKVRLVGGNSRFLVFSADLDTNRGKVTVYIPADSSGNEFPTVFVADNKLEPLTASALQQYVNGVVEKKATLEMEQLSSIELPKVSMPEPLKMIASDLDDCVIEATVGCSQPTIMLAKRLIIAELESMGFKGSQVKVSYGTQDGFICAAIINTPHGKVDVEIPVEVKNDVPLMPSVFAKNDFVSDFNEESLKAFVLEYKDKYNGKVIRERQLFAMNPTELKDQIINAAINNDLESCNEIMEVIATMVDEETYKNVASDYLKILVSTTSSREMLKQAHDDSDQFVKTPNSLYPIHKKLGRPITDLVRDEYGQYHLRSTYFARKNAEEEGTLFCSAKILCGDDK